MLLPLPRRAASLATFSGVELSFKNSPGAGAPGDPSGTSAASSPGFPQHTCFCVLSVFRPVSYLTQGQNLVLLTLYSKISLETEISWLPDFLGGVPWETDTENRTWEGGGGAELGRELSQGQFPQKPAGPPGALEMPLSSALVPH